MIFNVAFRIQEQKLLHLQRSISNANEEKRGSLEETQRILQEIDRINLSLGYRKKAALAFPKVISAGNEGYFYPRQQFRPEFLTKNRAHSNLRANYRRAIYPFNNQNYFYPAPYLQVPNGGKLKKFESNKYFYPIMYTPNAVPSEDYHHKKSSDGSLLLGTIVVLSPEDFLDRSPKSVSELSKKLENEKKAGKVEDKSEESDTIYDDIVSIGSEALGLAEEDDDEDDERKETIVSTTRLPSIKNDKYLNLALKKHPQELLDDENRKFPPPLPSDRAFNFSNPIEKLQNFTKQFSFNQSAAVAKESAVATQLVSSTPSIEDIEDAEDDKIDSKEDEKSPFGFAFGPGQQLQTYKEGGLIIQRLKVRRGGIAIAGPGGVATVRIFNSRDFLVQR